METPSYVPHLAAAYDRNAPQYRSDDEVEVETPDHRRLGEKLRQLCRSFAEPIRVLEIGCGTGRYFHWLENVRLLVGTDISAAMLKCAEHPVCEEEVAAREIRLVQSDIYRVDFPRESFDMVYALGVFGYGAAWTQTLSDKIHGWLAPGGRLFFNAIEVPHSPNGAHRFKEVVKANVYPILPRRMEAWLRGRETVPIVRHSRAQVDRVLRRSGFCDIVLGSHRCRSPLWNGVHLECTARKLLARVEDAVEAIGMEEATAAAAAAA